MLKKQNFYNLWLKTKQIARKIFMIALSVASVVGIFMFFRWVGFKGILSFLIGMSIMAYLLLSKNSMVAMIIKMTESNDHLSEIMKNDRQDTEREKK